MTLRDEMDDRTTDSDGSKSSPSKERQNLTSYSRLTQIDPG